MINRKLGLINNTPIEWLSDTVRNVRIKVESIEQVIQVNSAYKSKKHSSVEKVKDGYILEIRK